MTSWGRVAIAVCALLFAGPSLARGDGRERRRLEVLDASERDFRVAVAAHRRGDLVLAQEGYRQAIRRDGRFVEAMVNAARALLAAGERQGALHWLDRAEHEQPEYPQIQAVRGAAALISGDTRLAIDALGQAVALMPRDSEVRVNLAAAHIEAGQPERAIRVLVPLLELEPDTPDALYNAGLAHDHAGRPVEATHFYQRFLALAPAGDVDRSGVETRLGELEAKEPTGGAQVGDVLAASKGPSGQN